MRLMAEFILELGLFVCPLAGACLVWVIWHVPHSPNLERQFRPGAIIAAKQKPRRWTGGALTRQYRWT